MSLPLNSDCMRRLPIALLALVLAACSSDDPGPPPGNVPGPLKAGRFVDHPVEGLEFSSGDAPVSLTDRQGTFSYRDGAPVRFDIGDIALGSAVAGAVTVTPLQLAPGAADTTDPRVTNVARLLQTLDADCDLSNGIRLTPTARSVGIGRSIDFDQSEAAFGSDSAVQNFLEAAGAGCRDAAAPDNGLVSGALARQRLGETLTYMETKGGRANRLPTANAGDDFPVDEGAVATLTGAGTDDDGSINGYRWTQLSGPSVIGAPVLAASFNLTAPAVEADTTVTLRLRVTDEVGGTHDDDVTITIHNGTINDRPIANAGADQSVEELAAVTLHGENSRDPEEGQIAAGHYQWTQQASDAVRVTLSGANGDSPQFTAPVVASAPIELHFDLVVRDTQGLASLPDTVVVTIQNFTGGLAPNAEAGNDRPADEGKIVQLDGSGSTDSDGTITAYAWTQTAGPAATLTGADTATPTFIAPEVEEDQDLSFKLTVTDNHGNTGTDSVTVRVLDTRVISIDNVSVQEGDAGTAELTFTVSVTPAAGASITVHYATQDVTARAGLDYVAASGTLEFTAGETAKTLSVTVNGDNFDENDETLHMMLSGETGASLGVTAGIGTITDDDTSGLLRVGGSKKSIQPTQEQIDGIAEMRVFGAGTRLQKFNLGGFGVNPLANVPDTPSGTLENPISDGIQDGNEELTRPAGRRVFTNSQGQDENTYIRVMLIEQPGGDRVVFAMIDAIGAGNVIQKNLKAAMVAAADAKGMTLLPENILFGQTHSHTAADLQGLWGGVPQQWIELVLYGAAKTAMQEAIDRLTPARLSFRQGQTVDFNNYRRPRINPDADADGTITLLSAIGDDGTPIGNILQYNAHPTSIGDGNLPRTPHSEYVLGAMDWLENSDTGPGGTSLYFNGPIADASPSGSRANCNNSEALNPDPSASKFGEVRCRGEGMAVFAETAPVRALLPTLKVNTVPVTLPVTNPAFLALGAAGSFNRYYNFMDMVTDQIPGIDPYLADLPQLTPVANTMVTRVTLGGDEGGLEIVTIPGETTNSYAAYIRALAKTNVMLLGLTQNSFGYILPEEEFSYVDQSGDDGFTAPFTGYEEYVSLGPLTATILRSQGYNVLFDVDPATGQDVPPTLTACLTNVDSSACILQVLDWRMQIARAEFSSCVEQGLMSQSCPFRNALSNIFEPLAGGCRDFGGPEEFCSLFDLRQGTGDQPDADLAELMPDTIARGCDFLDPSSCLLPFPNDYFTVKAGDGTPQSVVKGGTGRRVNFNPLAMPRNAEGKPIDPTEWNRNDGFSPGQMIVTYVPGIGTVKGPDGKPLGPIAGAVPISDLSQYDDEDAPILVIDANTGARWPIYAEIDLNAGYLLPMQGFGTRVQKTPALLIRPAKNFAEGHRYVVVLRNIKNDFGRTLTAQPGFAACLPATTLSQNPVVQQRCGQLNENVFPVLTAAGIARDASLYLAWDFTVASAHNDVGRLVAMRDDAFKNYLGEGDNAPNPGEPGYPAGIAPHFSITSVTENPDGEGGKTVRRIQGSFTVPSYIIPADPSPGDADENFQSLISQLPAEVQSQINDGVLFAPSGLSLPPNRLNYVPEASNACAGLSPDEIATSGCALQARYGDGLPDRNPAGDLTTTFTCNIPRSAISNKATMADATVDDVKPVRPTLYGHGLLGGQGEGNGQASDWGNRYGFMVCAADWFGFASGDIGTVASALVDVSNFAAVADGSQQGILNQLFLARLAVHPQGFASNPNFQVGGRPVFDRREVFYDGNSQGGIMGGAVVAASKDINRGVLGVPGMNYSTLLARSTDFALYSVPLYLSYQDDLERPFILSLMQMLWDRSENNGYAEHITDNSAMGGPDNQVLLHPAFGDHQVTMWSADVMARTIGATVDRQRVSSTRHPDVDAAEYAFLEPLDYGNSGHMSGSAIVPFDEQWLRFDGDRCDANRHTDAPPIGNLPPNQSNNFVEEDGVPEFPPPSPLSDPSVVHDRGADPHECPRRDPQARCQMSHFLLGVANAAAGGTAAALIDPALASRSVDDYSAGCPAVDIIGAPTTPGGGIPFAAADYGTGLLGAFAQLMAELNTAITAMLQGDVAAFGAAVQTALTNFGGNLAAMPDDAGSPGTLIGLAQEPDAAAMQAAGANREAEAVVVTGASLPDWSAPAATGLPYPYPSGVGGDGEAVTQGIDGALGTSLYVRDAHNGRLIYPVAGQTVREGVPVDEIAAYAFKNSAWVEIPVQVDERMPYFLANSNSGFSFYSGTDQELSYVWDTESWGMTQGTCNKEYDTNGLYEGPNEGVAGPTPDPVPGLDNDDEVVFMAKDAGDLIGDPTLRPADVPASAAGQQIVLADPLHPDQPRFVYLFRKPGGSIFRGQNVYVNYERDANADEWIDRSFFADSDPQKLGTSNTGYGSNLSGTVCKNGNPQPSTDRFPRDGVTVTTDAYRWRASGRWMVRELHVAKPGQPGVYGPDLVDRWKGRAFQQSPESNVSVVGFEDEQVNWEANSSLLGERRGPVRAIREIWGADSGTNVTKTETFYRDAVAYRYHVRVHPIPPDGLYTSWDYNRGAMVSTDPAVPAGRYFTALRPQGVPIDGFNDDVGNVDGFAPVPGLGCPSPDDSGFIPPDSYGRCPAFFDSADPTFNLTLAFNNWEQVSGKGDYGSLVYTFENKGGTSYVNPLVVPYYRDDACLDDGTGDDPVQRFWPGESYRWNNGAVPKAYDEYAGRPLDHSGATHSDCEQRQGAFAQHGIHYFFTGDTDNAFSPLTTTEIDGQQWQFMVPTGSPQNIAEPYANIVRVPLQAQVQPLPGAEAPTADGRSGGVMGVVTGFIEDVTAFLTALSGVTDPDSFLASLDAARVTIYNLFVSVESTLYAGGTSVTHTAANAGGATPDESLSSLTDTVLGSRAGSQVLAGVGVVDMTPDVGYCAGQYCSAWYEALADGDFEGAFNDFQDDTINEPDPYLTHKTKAKSYGVQSRLTARAIVVEGNNGTRIALLKTDNYLAQDNLLRRVAQLLEQGNSGIGYEQILHTVTHNHSAAYSSTLTFGPWIFEDAYDARFFENQARRMAQAIEIAAAHLQPARMGATVVRHVIYKGNVVRLNTADDGTPAGYPLEYNDHDLTVMRFDAVDGNGQYLKPIATWINWGQHGEGNGGYEIHSADFVGALERFVERETGAPMVYSQGDVGSSENSGNKSEMRDDSGQVCGLWPEGAPAPTLNDCPFGQGVVRDFDHKAYAANERNVRFLADDVVKGWIEIGANVLGVIVPTSTNFPVGFVNAWVPGPVSHPYPSVSNCRSETTVEGEPGAPVAGLPDCAREGDEVGITPEIWGGLGDLGIPVDDRFMVWDTMKAEGIPVPDHYDAAAFEAVQENLRLKLQAFRLGEVLLASCACEAQNDLILNLKSRTDAQTGNIYDGFDWACLLPGHETEAVCVRQKQYYDPVEFPTGIPGNNFSAEGIAHMRAQVHNDARGWDLPENAVAANSEPLDSTQVWGNFTKEEIQDLGVTGFKLPVGVGHAGDYNGYTVSYREYMNRDSYRKALTTYGPHTADYMVTRLVRMAAQLKGGADFVPEGHDAAAQADEARQEAMARLTGQITAAAYDAWHAVLPNDIGPAAPLAQPASIGRFQAATFVWRGGSTAIDNPVVWVEKLCTADDLLDLDHPLLMISCQAAGAGQWAKFADQTGEVQTKISYPEGIPGVLETYASQFEWKWTANFEAYSAFPARLGSTPAGDYRFRVRGQIRQQSETRRYGFASNSFHVSPYDGLAITNLASSGGNLSFQVPAIVYPRTPNSYVVPTSPFRFISDNGSTRVCDQCSFRPWAQIGQFDHAEAIVTRDGATVRAVVADCQPSGGMVSCSTDTNLAAGETATVRVYDQDDNFGEASAPQQ